MIRTNQTVSQDQVYAEARAAVEAFEFNAAVAEVFPDMIARSVPGYAAMLCMIEQLSARFAAPETNIYDLGCSLGSASFRMQRRVPRACTIHAVDNSSAMLSRMREQHMRNDNSSLCQIEIHEADICTFAMQRASIVALNLTLQFIPENERSGLLQRVFDALQPGGALLLSEKICFSDSYQQQLMTALHHDFKRANGYSELEISQKRTALENRLIPETLETHIARLHSVGFASVLPWFQCFNFVSLLAVKNPGL